MVEAPKWGGMSPQQPAPSNGKLGEQSAQALHDVLSDLDAEIDKHVKDVFTLVQQIVSSQTMIDELYRKRSVLAADLGANASPEFSPTPRQRDMCGAAPYTPNMRFYRQHPLDYRTRL